MVYMAVGILDTVDSTDMVDNMDNTDMVDNMDIVGMGKTCYLKSLLENFLKTEHLMELTETSNSSFVLLYVTSREFVC